MKRTVHHSRVDLALHRLREGQGRPLLLLHGLGERSPHHRKHGGIGHGAKLYYQ